MSKLVDFLSLPNIVDVTEEIFVSERLGNFKVKPMTQTQWGSYQKRATGKINKEGATFDGSRFNLLVVAGQTVVPDFADAAMLEASGAATPSDFITLKMLPGEIAEAASKIIKLSGFTSINEDVEDAKN